MGRVVSVLSIAFASACSIEASGLGMDAAARRDGSVEGVEAGRDAAPARLDAMMIRAEDAATDAPAPPPDSGPTCLAVEESCNGVDDDCDAVVDESGCPCGTAMHADHVYLACTDQSGKWDDAQSFCAELGYHLVVIEDATENEAVRLLIRGDTWIGLEDRAVEGDYRWVDGTTPGYLNWRPGDAPRGASSPTYDCVEMDSATGEWLDVTCGGARPFVCETDPDR